MLVVSVHVPKSAGQSIEGVLQEHYGNGFVRDFGDRPVHATPMQRRLRALTGMAHCLGSNFSSVDCIHGHFLAVKYLPVAACWPTRFVTWMRHPVQRLLSHYYYWLREDPPSAEYSLHCRMRCEKWSLERFAFCPELRNLYSTFYWRFPLRWFAMVGIVEEFDADFAWFCERLLHRRRAVPTRNRNPDKPVNGAYHIDTGFEQAVAEFHADDMRLYEQAMALRRERIRRGFGN